MCGRIVNEKIYFLRNKNWSARKTKKWYISYISNNK